MGLRLIVIVLSIVFIILFVMGMAVGYYIALYQLKETELLALGAFAFAFLTWFGSGTSMLALLRDWFKDRREQESKPTLKYGDTVYTKAHVKTHGEEYDQLTYYLQIVMSSGEGMATDCHAFLSVPGLDIRHWSMFWNDGHLTSISIGDEENLHLFTVYDYQQYKKLLWHNPTVDYLIKDTGNFKDIVENQLDVRLVANGRTPKKRFRKTIKQIVEQAIEA
jgi:hypothetical protein